ncbi:MAG: PspA/IM30 family protein [Methylococcales bacterium]|nr:PspA/IM30 family protein [Methylococcales bacterium]
MKSLNRIFVSIKSQIDHAADKFENHEALAAVAIEDLQTIASKTRLHLHRVSKLSEQYKKQLEEQQQQARLWTERAVKAKTEDQKKALQCLKRLREAQRKIEILEQQLLESEAQGNKISNDLNNIQDQLLFLKNQKEMLAARQNRSHIQESLQNNQGNSLTEVQSIFERWEGSVVSGEYETTELADPLANTYEQEEDELALQIMLDELTTEDKTSEND